MTPVIPGCIKCYSQDHVDPLHIYMKDHVDLLHIYMKGIGYKIVVDLLCMDMLHMVVY